MKKNVGKRKKSTLFLYAGEYCVSLHNISIVYKRREGRQPHQTLKTSKKYKGQEAPHDGDAIIPKDAQMTPFRPEGLIVYRGQ